MNKKQKQRTLFVRILAIVIVLAMLLMSGYYLLLIFASGDAGLFVYAAESPETIEENLKKLDALRDVVVYIDENYSDDVNVEDLTDAAYNGVFDALDQWSVFYKTREEKDAFLEQVKGSYAGVGITMGLDSQGRCLVTQVNTLGPAFEEGVKPGMILLSVDGQSVTGTPLAEISALVRGEAGSIVVLELESQQVTQEFRIERRIISAQTVQYEMINDTIGYISISQFSGESWREFRIAKLELIAEGMKKLIVDLRGNGGGVMNDALTVAGMLIEEGSPLVYYEQQGEIIDQAHSRGGTFGDYPLVVLIDSRTASASECLAAAVKDNGAGTLVGLTTYGKGVAQELVTLDNGENFKLTFCHFLTPNKQRIDGVGITPDVAVNNGAQMTQAQIEDVEASLLPFESGKKYYAGQIGLTVLAAQQRLKLAGYDVEETARMDEKTVAALKRVQALYGACAYGGLDFCTIELVQRTLDEYLHGDGTDKQLQKAIEILQ